MLLILSGTGNFVISYQIAIESLVSFATCVHLKLLTNRITISLLQFGKIGLVVVCKIVCYFGTPTVYVIARPMYVPLFHVKDCNIGMVLALCLCFSIWVH